MTTIRNAVWLTGARFAADALSFLLFVTISRHFGPAGTGAYSYAFAIAGLITIGGDLGLEEYGIREYARLPDGARPSLLSALLGTQGLLVVVALAALGLFLLLAQPPATTAGIIGLLATYLLACALAQALFTPAFAHQAMVAPSLAQLVSRGTAVLLALLLVVGLHTSLLTALIGFPICGAMLVAVAAISASRYGGGLHLRTSWRAVARTARAALPFAASEVVLQVYARADLILLSLMIGEAAAGIYASGFKFVEVGVQPLVFLGVAAYPRLSQSFQADRQSFEETATSLLRRTLLLGGLLGWALYFLAPLVLIPLLGVKFAPALPVVRAMAGLAILQAVEIALVRLMLAAHLQLARFKLLAAGTVLNVGLNLLLIPLFGVTGAVTAWIFTLAVIDWLYVRVLRDRLASQMPHRSLVAFAIAVASGAGAGLLARSLASAEWPAAALSLLAYLVVAAVAGLVPRLGKRETAWLPALRL